MPAGRLGETVFSSFLSPRLSSGIKASASYFVCQSCNNGSKFIELLRPALELPALDCVPHGFVSNESEFRLAVSNILKKNHVARIVYGLKLYSQLLRLNLVSLRIGKVHG